MADRPILFSAPMVRALLAGTKTQTRRLVKPQPAVEPNGNWRWDGRNGGFVGAAGTHVDEGFPDSAKHHAPIQPGDSLWVREAWTLHDRAADVGIVAYQATMQTMGWTETTASFPRDVTLGTRLQPVQKGFRPSIHMPRWASRLTLHVTNVRVQRLQDISGSDAVAEGIAAPPDHTEDRDLWARAEYGKLWNSINGPGSWDANPWVAAYTFTVERANIDQARAAA